MGTKILAKPCVFFPLGCDRGECQPCNNILLWTKPEGVVKTLIFNTYYDEEQDKTPDKKRKQQDFAHCLIMLPKGGNSQAQESSQENVSICNTNVLHAPNECRHTASVPQVSIGVQNVSDTILHVPKTIFQHQAEFSCSKTQKNGMPMTINSLRPKNI